MATKRAASAMKGMAKNMKIINGNLNFSHNDSNMGRNAVKQSTPSRLDSSATPSNALLNKI
jgi:hypothetical protein